jgi:hypothetical protein
MGQYHCVYNLDKKEMLHPHHMGHGLKLLEWGTGGAVVCGLALLLSNSNGRGGGDLYISREFDSKSMKSKPLTGTKKAMQAAIDAVSGRWAGDRIVVQGDYAEKGDAAFISEKDLEDFKNISKDVVRALSADRWLSQEFFESDNFFMRERKSDLFQHKGAE